MSDVQSRIQQAMDNLDNKPPISKRLAPAKQIPQARPVNITNAPKERPMLESCMAQALEEKGLRLVPDTYGESGNIGSRVTLRFTVEKNPQRVTP